ncbi:MAG: hypothetical protein VKJ06_00280 [Vampirovibrionales bacterium]|nr:hypothetical protein [Vampirovibrionales bacterium]
MTQKTNSSNNLPAASAGLRGLNVFFALAQILAPSFHSLTGLGTSIARATPAPAGLSPEAPAGYAFGIWFVVFLLSLGYAVHQALPNQQSNACYAKIRGLTATLFALSTAWMLTAQLYGNIWPLAVIITLMVFCALSVFKRVFTTPFAGRLYSAIVAPMAGLYAGWLSVAVFLNWASLLKPWIIRSETLSLTQLAFITLGLASVLGLFWVYKSRGQWAYAIALIWALVGVWVTNQFIAPNTPVAILAVVLQLSVIAVGFKARRQPQSLAQ